MKYKLLQKLPGMEFGTIIEGDKLGNIILPFGYTNISNIEEYPDFFEEVKEQKTIYDLKKGEEYWIIRVYGIKKEELTGYFHDKAHINSFLTEREAKRNKLLRELATRTDKYLPKELECYINIYYHHMKWENDETDILTYHLGFVFRDEDEYNKWITEDNRKLLFEI